MGKAGQLAGNRCHIEAVVQIESEQLWVATNDVSELGGG